MPSYDASLLSILICVLPFRKKGNPASVCPTFCPMFTMELVLRILPVSALNSSPF